MTPLLLTVLALALPQEDNAAGPSDLMGPRAEQRYLVVDHLVPPDGAVLEVGGMDWLPDGRLAVSTRRGEVWLVADALAEDPAAARFTRFADGLWEGLGLAVVDGAIHVMQRGELSRLEDVDGDDLCDDVIAVSYGWGLSENYHEFGYGLPVDRAGNFYVALNVGFFSPEWWLGRSSVPYRGWALRVAPDGAVTPLASGFRSPCGISVSPDDELWITDNQGDWMPASPVFLVREGGFYGHPASLDWTDEYRATATLASLTLPPARASTDREPAALWLPYGWSRSPGNLVWDPDPASPYHGQAFIAELTNGMVLRAGFEDVEGVRQGWVVPWRHRVGSAVRVLFAPDGTLLAGLTNRGWGGLAPSDGIARVRRAGNERPLEVHRLALERDGETPAFRVHLTHPIAAPRFGEGDASLTVQQYHYDYWWEYGSPERETTDLAASAALASPTELLVTVPELEAGRVARLILRGVVGTDGTPLLHEEVSYTVNRLPGGGHDVPHVARIVPPPPARESEEEGWLRLSYGDAVDAWESEGWELVSAALDPDEPTRFRISAGNSHLTNTASDAPSDYVSKSVFRDGAFHVEFTLPKDGASTVWLMGRYGIRLADDPNDPMPCGTVLPGDQDPVRVPERSAYRGAGQLHELDVDFEAPRFDAAGRRTRPARFARVLLDDALLFEDVELAGPSHGAPLPGEVAEAPLVLGGTTGPVAYGNIRVHPRGPQDPGEPLVEGDDGWQAFLDTDDELPAGWRVTGGARWSFDGDLTTGEGPRGYLVSARGDYRDFELRGRARISDGGNAGLVLRAAASDQAGYEVELNSSFAAPDKTGSVLDLASVRTHLVAPDTWFHFHVTCRDTPQGVRLTTRINGVRFVDVVDTERRHAAGHITIEQHHEGSLVELEDLWIRER